jgi:hypothetical protein
LAAAVAFMWISALHISPFVPSTNMNVSNEDGRQARIKEAGESFKKRKKEKKRRGERESIHSMGQRRQWHKLTRPTHADGVSLTRRNPIRPVRINHRTGRARAYDVSLIDSCHASRSNHPCKRKSAPCFATNDAGTVIMVG